MSPKQIRAAPLYFTTPQSFTTEIIVHKCVRKYRCHFLFYSILGLLFKLILSQPLLGANIIMTSEIPDSM